MRIVRAVDLSYPGVLNAFLFVFTETVISLARRHHGLRFKLEVVSVVAAGQGKDGPAR